MGVYMTMDELSELVKAVKENAKSQYHDFIFDSLAYTSVFSYILSEETESSPPRSGLY